MSTGANQGCPANLSFIEDKVQALDGAVESDFKLFEGQIFRLILYPNGTNDKDYVAFELERILIPALRLNVPKTVIFEVSVLSRDDLTET